MVTQNSRSSRANLTPFVRRMQAARGIREAAVLLRGVAEALQLSRVAVLFDAAHPTAPTDEHGQDLSELLGWPSGFIENWLARNLTGRSSRALRARFELLPFVWTADEPPSNGEKQAGMAEVLRAVLSIGVTGAIIVPVRMPKGRLGTIGWLGKLDASTLMQLREQHGPALLSIAYYFFELLRLRSELPTVEEDRARLAPREVECLRATASGCSDAEIAQTTGLSAHTVRFYIRQAAEKLGARSRTSAVALAVQLGLLGPIG